MYLLFTIAFSIIFSPLFSQDNYFEQVIEMEDASWGSAFGARINATQNELAIRGDRDVHFYSFDSLNSEWVIHQVVYEEADADNFAFRMAFNSEILAIGAPGNSQISQENIDGEVYIYKKENELWVADSIIHLADSTFFGLGSSIFVVDSTIFVRAYIGNYDDYDCAIIEFVKSDGVWSQEQIIESPNSEDISFGSSIFSIEDKLFIASCVYNNGRGIVHYYVRNGVNWVYQMPIQANEPTEQTFFGYSMDYQDGILISAAVGHGWTGYNWSGLVYIFQFENEEWVETQIITSSDSENGDRFGSSLDIQNNLLLVGANNNDDGGIGSGSAYVFENQNGTWVETKKIIPSDAEGNDAFGNAVALNDNYVFVSACFKNNYQGAVYVYDPHDQSLHSNFAGDVRNGNAPVSVQFTSVPQGNPTSYAWDFNSDGTTDSTDPHPEFTYQIDGLYSVSLTVFGPDGEDTATKEDYIQVNSDILFGDVNADQIIDVLDLMLMVNFIMEWQEPTPEQFFAADVNYSGAIDILDISAVLSVVLE